MYDKKIAGAPNSAKSRSRITNFLLLNLILTEVEVVLNED